MTICCDSSMVFVELARRAQSTRPVKSGLFVVPDVLETSRAGSARVGSGQEAFKLSRVGSDHPYPTLPNPISPGS